jgi:hypothetical protein
MPNPLVDELSEQAKADLAAEFRVLARRFPPQRPRVPGSVTMRELLAAPRTGW